MLTVNRVNYNPQNNYSTKQNKNNVSFQKAESLVQKGAIKELGQELLEVGLFLKNLGRAAASRMGAIGKKVENGEKVLMHKKTYSINGRLMKETFHDVETKQLTREISHLYQNGNNGTRIIDNTYNAENKIEKSIKLKNSGDVIENEMVHDGYNPNSGLFDRTFVSRQKRTLANGITEDLHYRMDSNGKKCLYSSLVKDDKKGTTTLTLKLKNGEYQEITNRTGLTEYYLKNEKGEVTKSGIKSPKLAQNPNFIEVLQAS